MRTFHRCCWLFFFSFFSVSALSETREIAITIDDLPFVGTTHNKEGNLRRERERFIRIMETLKKEHVPATGFVIAGSIEKDQWELLEAFHQAGFVIGNHTYTHANLNQTDADKYIDDIARADNRLAPLLSNPKYFRYPYLAEGAGDKKAKVYDYLTSNGYVIAPVTVDSKDFRFNEQFLNIHWRNRNKHLAGIKSRYLNYIWRQTQRAERLSKDGQHKQILLIHANLLNSHAMGDIIQLYRDKGYKFISLHEALKKE